MSGSHRRHIVMALAALAVVFVAIFAIGAAQSPSGSSAGVSSALTYSKQSSVAHGAAPQLALAPAGTVAAPHAAARTAAGSAGGVGSTTENSASTTASGTTSVGAGSVPDVASAGSSVDATRIVRTGTLELSVPASHVDTTMTRLGTIASALGGYVASSNTSSNLTPSGTATLRIPVARFGEALTQTRQLGHVISATTTSHDVTGRYVNLSSRITALQQTRSTYLTILARARTIGATLAVQRRLDDVQSQIEQLQGEIGLLRHQSADATLNVDVTAAGAAVIHRHHAPTGLAAAWHTSTHRFSRGVDAIVGALGPLLLAILIAALLALVAVFGYRGARRIAG